MTCSEVALIPCFESQVVACAHQQVIHNASRPQWLIKSAVHSDRMAVGGVVMHGVGLQLPSFQAAAAHSNFHEGDSSVQVFDRLFFSSASVQSSHPQLAQQASSEPAHDTLATPTRLCGPPPAIRNPCFIASNGVCAGSECASQKYDICVHLGKLARRGSFQGSYK